MRRPETGNGLAGVYVVSPAKRGITHTPLPSVYVAAPTVGRLQTPNGHQLLTLTGRGWAAPLDNCESGQSSQRMA